MFGLRGQGGCVRRIEVFVKIQKNNLGGGGSGRGVGLGVRVDVIEELKYLGKLTKKSFGGSGGGVGRGCQVGFGLVGGVRVDVNAMLGIRGDVGYGRC